MMLKEFKRQADKMSSEERKAKTNELQELLASQQHLITEKKLPVVVLIEGWGAVGKGDLISKLVEEVDPRYFTVFSTSATGIDYDRYPFLYPFFCALPEDGKFLFMDGGWMESCVFPYLRKEITKKQYRDRIDSVNDFERTLRDNGYIVIKLFLNIGKMEQRKRIETLASSENTDWRVSSDDYWQNKKYTDCQEEFDYFMEHTSVINRWSILDSTDKGKLYYDAFRLITETVGLGIENGKYNGVEFPKKFPMTKTVRLENADLSKTIAPDTYKKDLLKYQTRLKELHNIVFRMKIPVIVVFEGWDAAGKGGAIQRLAYPLDPRGFQVFPIAAPEPTELRHHFLWRFWKRLPKDGHIAIYDRSWYGRVMVERIEGFCTENDWKRAYNEMNEFEQELSEWGAVIVKFWVDIDQDTQLERFNDRQNDPSKNWKITEEDWRNREKWPLYEEAVSEMLEKTSTKFAPWHIVESVDKKYARIKVLKTVVKAIEKAIDERK